MVSPCHDDDDRNSLSLSLLSPLQKNQIGSTYVATTTNVFLGRNYRVRNMEQMALEKDREIQKLQYEVEKAWYRADKSKTNLQSAEAIYQRYQDQYDVERIGRTKSQLAAAEAFQSLQTCETARDQLLAKVFDCTADQNINEGAASRSKHRRR
jgi:hypothetical protein